MAKILIAGGTGLIGTRLTQLLQTKGHEVILLSRKGNPNSNPPKYEWNLKTKTIDLLAVKQADYVINLAGAGIADKRWSAQRKKLIIESRAQSNALLLDAFRQMERPPKAFISAAAIGYYGDGGEQLLTEEDAPGKEGFLPESCIAWEQSIQPFFKENTRTVVIRVGIVMSTQGGAMAKMLPSYYARTGVYFGSGEQYYSWIHIDDLCNIFIKAIDDDKIRGVYNGVAPNPIPNKQLAKEIAIALDKPSMVVPAPTFALRLAMGEMADVVLVGSRVSSKKIEKAGFKFQFPDFIPAVKDLVTRKI